MYFIKSILAYQEFYYQHHGGNAYGFIWGKKIEGSGNLGRSSRQYAQLQVVIRFIYIINGPHIVRLQIAHT